MADVGVLNLKVNAESTSTTAQNLLGIADALRRIKTAVEGGIRLGNVGNSIDRFARKVNENLNQDVVNKITQVGEALSKLGNLSNVTINIRNGSVESTRRNMEEAENAASRFSEELVERLEDGMNELELLQEKTEILRTELDEGISENAFDDKRIVNYALQIMKLEEKVEDLQEVENRAGESEFWHNLANNADTVQLLSLKLNDLYAKMHAGIESGEWDTGRITSTALQITNLQEKIDRLREKAKSGTLTVVDEEARKTAEDFISTTSEADILAMRLEALKTKLGQGIISGTMDENALAKMRDQIVRLQEQYDKIQNSAPQVAEAISMLDDPLTDTTSKLSDNATEAKRQVDALLESLNNPQGTTSYEHYDQVIDKMLGIGEAAQKGKDYVQQFTALLAQRDIKALLGTLNNPVGQTDYKGFNTYIDRLLGVTSKPKKAKNYEKVWEDLLDKKWKDEHAGMTESTEQSANELAETVDQIGEQVERFAGYKRIWDAESRSWKSIGYTQEEIGQRIADVGAQQATISNSSDQMDDRVSTVFSSMSEKLKEAKEHLKDFAWIIRQIPSAMSGLKSGFSEILKPLPKLINQFMRIAKYRAIRYAIKQITDGFSDGIKNVYAYSKAIGGSFSQAMDDAASSLQTMRNSLGAAVAPLIQQLIPVLQTIVSWFITVINYVNQFFALLRGQATWTHAVQATTSAYEDQTSAAQGASAAVKDLLADWDELNIIQSESNGGGGGGAASDAEEYLNMFEELATFDNRIKKIVNFIKENFETIKNIALTIGAAVLAWRMANAFVNTLSAFGVAESTVNNIASTLRRGIAGVATLTVGIILGWEAGKKIAAEGLTTETILMSITSLVADAVGGYLIAGTTGAIGGVAIGIGVIAAGYIQEVNLKRNAEYQKLAQDAFEHANGNVNTAEFKKALEDEFTERIGKLTPAIDAFSGMPQVSMNLKSAYDNVSRLQNKLFGEGKLTSQEVAEFKENWKAVTDALTEMNTISFKTIDLGIGEMLRNANSEAQTELINLRKTFKELAALQNGTISEMEYEMDQIIARLASGTGSAEEREADIEKYKQYLNVIATMSKSEIETISGLREQAKGFDFMSGEGTAAENAQAFIDSLGQMVKEANQKVDEWEKVQMDSYASQRQMLNAMVDAGLLKKEVAQPYIDAIDEGERLVREHAESIREQNTASVADAMDTVFKQALAGYREYIKNGGEAGQYYEFIRPVLDALTNAGYEIPDQFQQMHSGSNGKLSLWETVGNWLGFNTANKLSMADVEKYLLGENPENIAETAYEKAREVIETITNRVREGLENREKFDGEQMSILGISTEGGWFNNLWNSMTQIDENADIPGVSVELEVEQDPSLSEPVTAPSLNTESFNQGLSDMWLTTKQYVSEIMTLLSKLQNISYSIDTNVSTDFNMSVGAHGFATGGFPKSGDLVMANENGNFEMMGRMGHQPVVANNQQIVDGISRGVTNANGNVVTEMRTMVTLMQRLLNKEIVAKAVPSSGWGRNNSKSAEAYSKVTG